MRVLVWSEGFWPDIGGVPTLSAQHVCALARRGYDCLVISSRSATAVPAQDVYHGIPVHRFAFAQALLARDAPRIWAIRRQVAALKEAFQPDVIHIHECGSSAFFHLLSRSASPAPVLLTIHSLLPQMLDPHGLLTQMLRSADAVAAVSQAMLDDVRSLAPDVTPRTSLVYNGLALPELQPTPLTAAAFAAPRLLCLGRVVVEKGFDVALAAFARLAPRYPTARLTVAGDGPARADLERQVAALGLADRVEFTGWVLPEDVPALIDAATVVVMPSRWREPFGLVALEAGLMTRPIVATRVGGLAEVVAHGETGLLVENEDSEGLADAIGSLLDHPTLASALGQAGRRRAQERFNAERFVDAHETLYRRLVERRGRGA